MTFDLVQFMAGLLVGISTCYIVKTLVKPKTFSAAPIAAAVESKRNKSSKIKVDDDVKMVILVRTDINMAKGKAAAQCCHAVLATYKEAVRKTPQLLEAWEESGQAKVTLKIDSQEELYEYGFQMQVIGM